MSEPGKTPKQDVTSRRDFIKLAAVAASVVTVGQVLPLQPKRAMAASSAPNRISVTPASWSGPAASARSRPSALAHRA